MLGSRGSCADRRLPERPLLYHISDRRQLPEDSLLALIRRLVRWGIDIIQIREKDLADRELYDLALRARRLTRRSVKLLINGRADIALAVGADGVHLPARSLDPGTIRRWAGQGFLIGLSAHSVAEVKKAEAAGADYALLGPVFWTESKRAYGLPLGLARLRQACAAVSIPVLGLGGIRRETVKNVLATGAAGVAAITMFQRDLWTEGIPRSWFDEIAGRQ